MKTYAYPGPENQTLTAPEWGDFTTYVLKITSQEEADQFEASIGAMVPYETQHKASDLEEYSVETLARWGVVRTVVADPPRGLPAEIPMYKVRNKLIDLELDDDVEAWLNTLGGKSGKKARNLWNTAPGFLPAGDLAQAFKAAQGLSDQQFEDWCWEAFNSEG